LESRGRVGQHGVVGAGDEVAAIEVACTSK
jgi:hypothetical protein